MSRRRQRRSPFSLFAFQDIITAVTGIMLLITLLLTLELVGRQEEAGSTEAAPLADSSKEVAGSENIESEIATLAKDLHELRSDNALLAKYDVRRLREDLRKTENENARQRQKLQLAKEGLSHAERRRANARQVDSSRAKDEEALRQLQDQLRKSKTQLEDIRKSGRIFLQAARNSTKHNWLVEITKAGARAAPVGKASVPVSFPDVHAFERWLSGRKRATDHFVLLVKADGISLYGEIASLLDSERFSKGFDVLPQGETVLDDDRGAIIP